MHAPLDRITLTRSTEPRGSRIRSLLLAGLCLAAVVLGLHSAHRRARLGEELLRLNQAWSERLARHERMGQLTLEISAPANELYDSGDLEAETARSRSARAAFAAALDTARLELRGPRAGAARATLGADLDAVEIAIAALTADVDRAFDSYGVRPPPDFAVIDGHLLRIHERLAHLARSARAAQAQETARHLAAAAGETRGTAAALVAIAVLGVLLIARRRSTPPLALPPEAAEAEVEAPAPPRGARIPPAIPIGLCVLTAGIAVHGALGLSRIDDRLLAEHREWSERLASYGRMGRLTLEISGPCNQVFDSGDLAGETARSQRARAAFAAAMDSARRALANPRGAASNAAVLDRLYAVNRASRDLVVDVDRTFASYGVGMPPDAAVIHRHLARIQSELGTLARRAREAQGLEARRLLDAAAAPQRTATTVVTLLWGLAGGAALIARLRTRRRAIAATPEADEGEADVGSDPALDEGGSASEPAIVGAAPAPIESANGTPASEPVVAEAMAAVHPAAVPIANVPMAAVPMADVPGAAEPVAAATVVPGSERESELPAWIEDVTEGIITADDAGLVTAANPAAERIFRYRPGDLIGRHVRELIPGPARAVAGGPEQDAGPGPWPAANGARELMGRRRNGSVVPLELTVRAGEHRGVRSWTGVVRDVTQRRQAEALRAGNHRVLDLLASRARPSLALAELIRLVEEQQPEVVCTILIQPPGHGRLRVGAASALAGELLREVESVEIGPSGCTWGAAAHTRSRVIVEDTATHLAWAGHRRLALDHGLRSSWAEPILSAGGEPLGVVAVFRRRVHVPGPDELDLIATVARLASLALDRARGEERISPLPRAA